METEDVVIDLQEDNNFTLNCTYHKDKAEYISDRGIRWQKQINGTFENVAFFSHAGGAQPYIRIEMKPFYENRTELIGPNGSNTSLSAVMIIKDPVCTDEGTYRCWIEYFDENSHINTVSSVVVFNSKFIPPTKCRIFRIYQTLSIIHLIKVYHM